MRLPIRSMGVLHAPFVATVAVAIVLLFPAGGLADLGSAAPPAPSAPATSQSTAQPAATTPDASDATPSAAGSGGESAAPTPSQSPAGSGTSAAARTDPIGDQGAQASQGASAAADGSQDSPRNDHVVVQVDKPGGSPSVDQSNTVVASASAQVSNAVDQTGHESGRSTKGPGATCPPGTAAAAPSGSSASTVCEHVAASSSASQVDGSNSNVSVLVNSPGAVGAVSQANTARAVAQSRADAARDEALAAASKAVADAASSAAVATEANPTNANVVVRVLSPGDNGAVEQSNEARATGSVVGSAGASTATARAAQTGAQNTNVSIRVGSDGVDGPVSQGSVSTATSSDASGTIVNSETTGLDTNVNVSLPGSELSQPKTVAGNGDAAIWNWTWGWTRDGSAGQPSTTSGAVSANQGISSAWGSQPAVGQQSDARQLEPGTFVWTWVWTRPDQPSWNWNWSRTATIDCSCVWVWKWDWTWTGQSTSTPDSTPAAGVPNGKPATITQSNMAAADASASADASIAQTLSQDTGSGSAFAGQLATVGQTVSADASALQAEASNVDDGTAPVLQSNAIVADAGATARAEAAQAASQQVAAGGSTAGLTAQQWSGQQITLDQRVSAEASAAQMDAGNTLATGTNSGVAAATALAAARAGQDAAQAALAGAAALRQWVGELTDVTQSVGARARTGQHATRNDGTAKAAASGSAVSISMQSADQTAVGLAGLGSQTVRQLIAVDQSAGAAASTQDGLVGLPTGHASSHASATDAALVEELAVQGVFAATGIAIQDLTQNGFVQQIAQAISTSSGGTGGQAQVVNCTTVGQASAQGIDVLASASATDRSDFCWAPSPAAAPPVASSFAPAVVAAQLTLDTFAPQFTSDTVGPKLTSDTVGPQLAPTEAAASAVPAPWRMRAAGPVTGLSFARASHTPVFVSIASEGVAGAHVGISTVSVPTVTASSSGRTGLAAEDAQLELSLLWLPGLVSGTAFPAQGSSGGGGATSIVADATSPALPESWRVITVQAVRRPGSLFFLRLRKPG